jgi:hypothetical protein
MASDNGKNRKARTGSGKKSYVKPVVTKHGSLNSQIASFRTFY